MTGRPNRIVLILPLIGGPATAREQLPNLGVDHFVLSPLPPVPGGRSATTRSGPGPSSEFSWTGRRSPPGLPFC